MYNSEAEAQAAGERGEFKAGDIINIAGQDMKAGQ